jgi:hypothetical protein
MNKVTFETTPNPATMKFLLHTKVSDEGFDCPTSQDAERSPLAAKAFMLANGDAYSFGPLGVFFTRRDGSPMPVCGPLEVVAKVRSSEGEDWRLALKWTDQDGHFRQGLIPCSALMKSPAQVVAYLADNGLEIRHAINSQGGSAYIVNFLNRFPVRARVLGVDHHGWVNHGEAFSIPRLGIIGKSETSGIIYTGDPKAAPRNRGRLRTLSGLKA